jgi:hypothetical protein
MMMELITDVYCYLQCDTFTVSANSASVEQLHLQLQLRVDPCMAASSQHIIVIRSRSPSRCLLRDHDHHGLS